MFAAKYSLGSFESFALGRLPLFKRGLDPGSRGGSCHNACSSRKLETPLVFPIPPDTALSTFTIGSAWVNRLEADTGTIEVGKSADLVVLDRNLRSIPDGRVADAAVMMTFIGGEEVYAA